MTDPSRDEVVSWADAAKAVMLFSGNRYPYSIAFDVDALEGYTTLARAPLVEQLDIQAGSIEAVQAANQRLAAERDALKAELERMKAGEPVAEVRAKSDGYGGTFVLWKKLPVAGMNLYTSPHPSAVKVVQQMMEALDELIYEISSHNRSAYCELDTFETTEADAALAAGQQYLKEQP